MGAKCESLDIVTHFEERILVLCLYRIARIVTNFTEISLQRLGGMFKFFV